jgi:hypothetical protein
MIALKSTSSDGASFKVYKNNILIGHNGLPFDSTWACITLTAHSSLSAVGFLAAITGQLSQAGMSIHPVSAYYHDHLFVPWESKWQAIDLLRELSYSQHRIEGRCT